jgi:hypothetical protein
VFLSTPGHSSWLSGVPDAEMDDARDSSWSRCGEMLALLGCQASPSGD